MPSKQKLLEAHYIYDHQSASGAVNAPMELGMKLARGKQTLVAVYDFAVLGGAVGSVNLKDVNGKDAMLPEGAVIQNVMIDTVTAPTSGGAATIALTANSAADLKAATAIASYTGIIAGVPVAAASAVKCTADRNISAVIAVAALTAGKINVMIDYVLSI